MDKRSNKDFFTLLSVIFGGFMFISGAANFGYAAEGNSLMASLVKFAQTLDAAISPEIRPFVPPVEDSLPQGSSTIDPSFNNQGTGTKEIIPFRERREDRKENMGGEMREFKENGDQNQRREDNDFGEDEPQEEFIDPREVKNILREMRDMKRELKRMASSAKKLQNADTLRSDVEAVSLKVNNFEQSLKSANESGTGVRDVVEEYRDAEIWNEISTLRSKIELPKQLKNTQKEFKRLKRVVNQKSFQKLGLNLENVKSWIIESEGLSAKLNELYASGNWEELNLEMEELFDWAHPGEVSSVIYRMRDIYARMRYVKDPEIKAAIEDALSEVKESFNSGDYRAAREALDDYYGELEKLIRSAAKIGKRGGMSEEDFDEKLGNLRGLIESKLNSRMKNKEDNEDLEPPLKEPAPSDVFGE